MSFVTVKTNPLFHPPTADQSHMAEEKPLFYGQRRNIRKTKEQEMITAILELAKHGEYRPQLKLKIPTWIHTEGI